MPGKCVSIRVKTAVSECPAEPGETGERFYMGRMEAAESQAFRMHLAICARCRKAYEDAVVFVDAMRAAMLE